MAIDTIKKNTRYFVHFISEIRPKNNKNRIDAVQKILSKIDFLQKDQEALADFQKNSRTLLLESNIEDLFSNKIDLYSSENMIQQFFKDISYKILPPLEDKNSINYKLHQIFYKKNDSEWINELPDELWLELIDLSSITNSFVQEHFKKTLHNMFLILSYKIAALGMDEELSDRFITNGEIISPFIQQNREVSLYIENIEHQSLSRTESKNNLSHLIVMLNQCQKNIETIRKNTMVHGTSLKQSYVLNRLESNINRLKILVDIVDQKEFNYIRFIHFLKEIIYNNNHRHNIAHLLSNNIGYLAYQIAEHKGNAGDHYITSNRKEYFDFFKSAFGGGIVIAFLVIIKSFTSQLPVTDFWMAVLYSLIYGLGFVFIHLSGFTVATKQPAMTASALAKEIDNKKDKNANLNGVALMMAKVNRSQFIAIIGNSTAVFPFVILICFIVSVFSGHPILDEKHATKYLDDINPKNSLCWWYGAIAGFYLFLSGIVAGFFDNSVVYSNIPERIRQHPGLNKMFSTNRVEKIATYLNHNFGAIMSNIMIGIFLGTASLIGKIFGIPFDIRHVTFSLGNFAMSLQSLDFQISIQILLWVFFGIFSIGFFNIVVSFGMAFYIAIKSRNTGIEQLLYLPKLIFIYFKKYPKDFFYPPNADRIEEDVFIQ